MRLRITSSLALYLALGIGIAAAADAQTVDAIWTAITGSGTPGSSTITAANGDVLDMTIFITAGPGGVREYSNIALSFDVNLDDELDLFPSPGTSANELSPGFSNSLDPPSLTETDSSLSMSGSVSPFDASNAPNPGEAPFNPFMIGMIQFKVANVSTDGIDAIVGFIPPGFIFDNAGVDVTFTYSFNAATVNAAAPPIVPVLGVGGLAALACGLGVMVLMARRHFRPNISCRLAHARI